MDTFGVRLRSSREKKGYSLEQVARDTNIAKRYLSSLEEENFSIFPAETYLIGFLKSYSEYLDLNPRELVNLYHKMKLQEQPVPIEALLNRKRNIPIRLLSVFMFTVLIIGAYFLYQYINAKPVQIESPLTEEIVQPAIEHLYDITITAIENRFVEGSEIQIQLQDSIFNFSLKSISTNAILSFPDGETVFNLGEEKMIDLDRDKTPDISVALNDIDINAKTATLKISALKQTETKLFETDPTVSDTDVSNVTSRNQAVTVILENQNATPFDLNAIFTGKTLIRYRVDSEKRVEQYFEKGERFRVNINREVMLWISNAGFFNAKISGIQINLGKRGKVSTNLIKWNINPDSGKYELQIIPVY